VKSDFYIYRSWSIKYLLLATSSLTTVIIGSVFSIMQGHLPCRIWLPFNYNLPLVFSIIAIHQIITLIFATMISIGTDTLVLGLFIQTCAQLEIFESRLHKLIINKTVRYLEYTLSSKDKMRISECVHHHLGIYK